MTRADEQQARPRRGLTEKYEAIMRAAQAVFGRVGYRGASIDVIAAEAGVSTRTIYNHFDNKEQLFTTVLTESSRRVAAAHEAIIESHLGEVTDLETDLIALSKAWVRPAPEFTGHFAIVRMISAEIDHFPRELYEAWQEAGPRRVQRSLAAHLAALGERGLLNVADPEFAAHHFSALLTSTMTERTRFSALPLEKYEIDEIATIVVRSYLYGYLPRS